MPPQCTNDKLEYVRTDGWTDKGKSKYPPPFSGGIIILIYDIIHIYPSFNNKQTNRQKKKTPNTIL